MAGISGLKIRGDKVYMRIKTDETTSKKLNRLIADLRFRKRTSLYHYGGFTEVSGAGVDFSLIRTPEYTHLIFYGVKNAREAFILQVRKHFQFVHVPKNTTNSKTR